MDIKLEPVEEEDNEERSPSKDIFFDMSAQLSESAEDFQEIVLSIKSEDVSNHLIVKEEAAVGVCMEKSEDSQYGVESSSSENVKEQKFQSSKQANVKREESPSPISPAADLSLPYLQIDTVENNVKEELKKRELVAVLVLEKRTFNKRNFVCGFCFGIFSSKRLLKRHNLSHYCEKKNIKISNECENSLSRKNDAQQPGLKPYKCDDCSFRTAYFYNIKKHKKTHSGLKPFKCDECSFSAGLLSYLKKHKLIHLKQHKFIHLGKITIYCDQCSFKTTRWSYLKNHQITHSGLKPFKCDQCSYSAFQLSHLKQHKLKHSGEKPFKCGQCSFGTTNSSHLQYHKMTHSGLKPFKCDQCNFDTIKKSNLKQHELLHSGQKPFKCDQCSFETAYLTRLKKHKTTHSGQINQLTASKRRVFTT